MAPLSDSLIQKIARSLQEEEVDIYVLNLYYRDSEDIEYFDLKDRERVRHIFDTLIEDTKRHAEILKLIVQMKTGTP